MNKKIKTFRTPDINSATDIIRFWTQVRKTDSCWIWTGYVDPRPGKEYGYFCCGGKHIRAHRFSYALVKPITYGLVLDHLCGNKLCVNPEHLEEVPQGINAKRWYKKQYAKSNS